MSSFWSESRHPAYAVPRAATATHTFEPHARRPVASFGDERRELLSSHALDSYNELAHHVQSAHAAARPSTSGRNSCNIKAYSRSDFRSSLSSAASSTNSNTSNSSNSCTTTTTLPSVSELLACRILVAPSTGVRDGSGHCQGLPPLRRDSVCSFGAEAQSVRPMPDTSSDDHSDSSSDGALEAERRPAAGSAARHYSPSSSAAAFGHDGNFQPIHAANIASSGVGAVDEAPRHAPAALYADPEFTPSGAGYTAEYQGVKVVPGFGNYHVYEGGFCIPTHIDGEAVNPVWGLTKSKNPRKRLPIACGWCRKKKIRCEPSHDGCLQCKKAKRQCEMCVRPNLPLPLCQCNDVRSAKHNAANA